MKDVIEFIKLDPNIFCNPEEVKILQNRIMEDIQQMEGYLSIYRDEGNPINCCSDSGINCKTKDK